MRHFRVQLLGGAAMMGGTLAEMQTGEGKSLTALLPAVSAALMGRPVHIVTVNDYLARRDAEQFRAAYNALGLTVGLVEHGQQLRIGSGPTPATSPTAPIRNSYSTTCEIASRSVPAGHARACWLTSFSRPSSAGQSQRLLLRGLHFAIVDEADSVLIDEARTPLILSGMQGEAENDAGLYETALDFARRLVPARIFMCWQTRRRYG